MVLSLSCGDKKLVYIFWSFFNSGWCYRPIRRPVFMGELKTFSVVMGVVSMVDQIKQLIWYVINFLQQSAALRGIYLVFVEQFDRRKI